MDLIDTSALEAIDRYRAAYQEIDREDDTEPPARPYAVAVTRFMKELSYLSRLTWAILHPLEPLAADIMVEVGGTEREELKRVLSELSSFGHAILIKGDRSRVIELRLRAARERQEAAHRAELRKQALTNDNIEIAQKWAEILRTRLQLIEPKRRAQVLAEIVASLPNE